jgi:hypothetical protein
LSVRPLRTRREAGRFERDVKALSDGDRRRVRDVVKRLCLDETLPGADDVDELIPPCKPNGWRRPVPETSLWVYYNFTADVRHVDLYSVRIPRELSDEALEALREELEGPPPHPYLQPVPDPPSDDD